MLAARLTRLHPKALLLISVCRSGRAIGVKDGIVTFDEARGEETSNLCLSVFVKSRIGP